MTDGYDLVVLGGGTGGYAVALHAAHLGMKVALAERDLIGGTCLNRGCIPTKALLHSAETLDALNDAPKFGIKAAGVSFDWDGVQQHKAKVVKKLVSGLESLLKSRKVEVVKGEASLAGGGVRVGDRTLQAKNVVVATGSQPKSIPGLEIGERIITSDQALEMKGVPKSAIVLGGGSVGVEFASMWASFGATVTIVEMLPSLVPLEDADLGAQLAKSFSKRGVKSLVGAKLEEAKAGDDSVMATVSLNGKTETIEAEILLVAVGRGPVTDGAGLDGAGVATDRGYVTVNESLETSAKGVFGVGDVIALKDRPHPQLAHVAFAEGIFLADHLAGNKPTPINYDAIPRATYCTPEVAAVGLTESQARERGHDVVTKVVNYAGIGKAAILGENAGFCKVVAEKDGPILGVHYIGPRVTELVAEAMLAVGWEALPEEVAALIHPHPTLSESFGEATLALAGKALHTAG
ncbi:MAG: dihydrolipoyl dehydrogenase [Actinomycetota bacterium]|nr:dihydrolipoyl dehydrogenase [Actinomycetota bacterium]